MSSAHPGGSSRLQPHVEQTTASLKRIMMSMNHVTLSFNAYVDQVVAYDDVHEENHDDEVFFIHAKKIFSQNFKILS